MICGEILSGKAEIKEHRRMHTNNSGEKGEKVLECAVCGEMVRGHVEINRHKQGHRKELQKRPRQDEEQEGKEEGEVVVVQKAVKKAFVAPRRKD